MKVPGWRFWKTPEDEENAEFNRVFEELSGRPPIETIRSWPDEDLHKNLVENRLEPYERSIAERELERRKAWEQPGGRAFWISCGAFAVSVIALGVSIWS